MRPRDDGKDAYGGFEQGPIRPPSEADSLLIRVTRNCPWNRCTFCPVYKGAKFSVRPVDHVKRDIDAVHRHVEAWREWIGEGSAIPRRELTQAAAAMDPSESQALAAAVNWMLVGMRSVFLQDANSLVIKPAALVEILTHLGARLPSIERITSYARSQTLARMKDEDLRAIGEAGLNRIHVGLESGSDEVLERVNKGVTKAVAIEAGLKVRRAGIELSEYHMPGLGGVALSEVHALESADALSQIDPDFIRLRTLAIPPRSPLFEAYTSGDFEKCTDRMVAGEILLLLEHLHVTSVIKSDHVLNLFGDLEGTLPRDRERMVDVLRAFLDMDPQRQMLYQVGRRLGVFYGLGDMDDPQRVADAEAACRQLGVTPDNVDETIDAIMARFV